jgi:hypothetical protein
MRDRPAGPESHKVEEVEEPPFCPPPGRPALHPDKHLLKGGAS